MSEIIIPESGVLTDEYLHNPYGFDEEYEIGQKKYGRTESTGWYFGAGNPENWKFSRQLLIPGGTLLDVGCGTGRSSMYFAMNGMRVTGVDPEVEQTDCYRDVAHALGLNVEVVNDELQGANLSAECFDTVLLDHTFAHSRDHQEAYEVLKKAYSLLKPGGYIWVRANGIEDSRYWEMESEARRGYRYLGHSPVNSEIEYVEEGLLEHPCGCSGAVRMDRSLFFEQLDLPAALAGEGAKIEHLQVIPMEDTHNLMFGEDYNRGFGSIWQSGTVSILARKPAA